MAILLAVSSVPFVFSGGAAYADTSEDTVAPQITSVEIVGEDQSYAPGDAVTVRIGFVEEGTGVSSASDDLVRDETSFMDRLPPTVGRMPTSIARIPPGTRARWTLR